MREITTNNPRAHIDYDPIDDGEIIQISFSTALCDYLRPAGGICISLTVEIVETCRFTAYDYTLKIDAEPPTSYDFSDYKTEPNIILTLKKHRMADYEIFEISVNGEYKGNTTHIARRSGRVDGAHFFVPGKNEARLGTDMPVISYAVFNGPDAAEEAQTRVEALRNFPAFQRSILSRDRINNDRERASEDGKVEKEGHEETSERKEQGRGHGAGSGQSSNDNIPPGQDHTRMQDASSIVWRRAVDLSLGSSVYANVKAIHDGIMDEWVKTRGGKLTSSDYDYLVYSAGFGWPDAIQKVGTDADFSKVQEKYREIVKYF